MSYRVTYNPDLLPDEPSTDHDDYPAALNALIERMGELHYSDMRDTYKQGNPYDISYRYTYAIDDDGNSSLHVRQIGHADEYNPTDEIYDFATIASLD
jgi:hypothetical protein